MPLSSREGTVMVAGVVFIVLVFHVEPDPTVQVGQVCLVYDTVALQCCVCPSLAILLYHVKDEPAFMNVPYHNVLLLWSIGPWCCLPLCCFTSVHQAHPFEKLYIRSFCIPCCIAVVSAVVLYG